VAQVMTNLVGNALQHSKANPIRVELAASDDSVTLTVRNPGHIPFAVSSRLFEPFKRGDQASKGLGLGLYIVREIVRSHGGRIDVSSDPSRQETAFVVTLPRAC
jgi:two-component system, sensor histidine kinase and response regulator